MAKRRSINIHVARIRLASPHVNAQSRTQQGRPQRHMQEASTRKIYDVHAMFYDATFGRLVRRRIERAIHHMNIGRQRPGAGPGHRHRRLAELLPAATAGSSASICPAACSARPQEDPRARPAIARSSSRPTRCNCRSRDNTFDHVFISHVISVVSDPIQLVQEAQRVAKPGARIVIVNHFQSTNRFIALVEKWLCPLCTKLGWRSDLALQDLIRRTGVEIDYRYKLESIDLWETVVITNNKSALGTLASRPATVAA